MRPLKIKPARDITELALSPDGRQFGVIQSHHGFRLYDALSGDEIGGPPEHGHLSAHSPTGRHFLSLRRERTRLAEVTAGRPWLSFQAGWTRAGEFNRPPAEPGTLPLPSALQSDVSASQIAVGAIVFDRWGRAPQSPAIWEWTLLEGALSADHRFAVGRFPLDESRRVVLCDLASETLLATDLDLGASPSGSEHVRAAFSPDGTRVFAVTRGALFVFDLPPVNPDPADPPGEAPVLKPAVVIPATQPQPDINPIPPFAVLPCGRKVLLRGEHSRVELRDLATGELMTAWKWLRKVNSLAIAADGLTAAAGGADGRVVIWDLE